MILVLLVDSVQESVISSAIGKIETAIGSVTIARTNADVAHPAVGDLVYEGDLIETGIDGLVGIVFVDGTTFHLHASARMVLNEFIYGAEKSSNSALLQVTKGLFSFLAGKVATTGRLIIDTPLGKIRSTAPAAGIGSLAFSVLTVCLIREVEAAGGHNSWSDNEKILPSNLVHGIFEVTDNFGRLWIVDRVDTELVFHLGSSNAEYQALSATQILANQDYYRSAYSIFSAGNIDTNPTSTHAGGSGDPVFGTAGITLANLTTVETLTVKTNNNDNNNTLHTPPPPPGPPPPGPPPPPHYIPATITALPISNDFPVAVQLSGGAYDPKFALNVSVPVSEHLIWIRITGLPPGETIFAGEPLNGGHVVATGVADLTHIFQISAIDYSSGLWLSGHPGVQGTLTITAKVSPPGAGAVGTPFSTAILDLTTAVNPPTGPFVWTKTDPFLGTLITGAWEDPTAWSALNAGTLTPTNVAPIPFADVVIPRDPSGNAYTVTLNISSTNVVIDSLLVGSSAGAVNQQPTLEINGNLSIATTGISPLHNFGTIEIGSGELSFGIGSTLPPVHLTAINAGMIVVDATGTFKVDTGAGALSLSGGGLVTLTAGAITGAAGTETFDNLDNLIQGTGTISNLLLLDNSGTIEATGGLLTLNTGHQIDNDGTGVLEASSGATLEIDDSLNNDGQLNTNGGTIDFKGGAIVNNNAVNGIAIDHTFKVDVATLSLSGGGLVTLTAGAITGAAGTETFDNLDNLIQGTGTISNLLLLDNSGTIEATGGLLTLNTGHQIDNDGTGVLEASSGATLEIDDSLNNDGQLNTNGGTIDFKGGAIVNNNAVNGIAIDHTFKVDVATLSLSGGGLVTLTAGAITGAAGTETFDNLDNLIQGTGTISNLLLLDNSGTIEATGGLLTLNTGHQIDNDGTGVLEASSGATLEIDDSLNNDGQLNTNGGTIDFKGGAIVNNNAVNGIAIDHTFKVDVATLSLSGGGLVTLTAGAITGAAGTETFDNLDNLIQGTGTISNLLLLDNSGTIEATGGLLTLNTGHQIDNDGTGVLEASSGATLEIDDSLNNDGQLNTNGGTIDFKGGAIVNNNAVNGIAIDHTFKVDVATLSLSGGGLVTLTAGAITGAAGTETFDNLDNLIQGTGTISNLLLLDNSGTIEATGGAADAQHRSPDRQRRHRRPGGLERGDAGDRRQPQQ